MKQRIVFGNDKIKQLRKLIETINPKTILILTGNKSYSRSGSKKLIEFLIEGYKNQRFANFSTDPKYEDVKKGVKLIKETNLNIFGDFNIGKSGDDSNQRLDSSWLLLFTNNGETYTMENRGMRYIFESDKEIRFSIGNKVSLINKFSTITLNSPTAMGLSLQEKSPDASHSINIAFDFK